MKLNRVFAAAFVAILLCASHAGANAAEPEERFLLTPALLAKLKAATPDIKKLEKADDEQDEGKEGRNLSATDFIKVLDKEPRARAVLAKHGLSTREFAMSTYAMMHAGMFVALEPSMNKKQAAEMLSGFTREQQANVALLRKTDLSTFK
jgi:hypothetical protein